MEKMLKILTFLCIVPFGIFAQSPHMVVCTFKKYPTLSTSQSENKKFSPVANTKKTQGIFGSYFGYLTNSNEAGQLVFPRKHHDSIFTLTIAETIEPIFMVENTLNTWKIPDKVSYASYTVERKQDQKTSLYFWDVQKEELPKDRALPLNAIIILAKPEELYVPTGITVTNNSPQLSLPPIFVKDTIRLSDNALAILPIRQFFESLNQSTKTTGADVQGKFARTTS